MERAVESDSQPAGVDAVVAGSDAERRAALALAERLRAGGRTVAVETQWVRPRWQLTHALHAGLGVLASLIAVGAPAVGLALALVTLLSLLLDLGGRGFLLRRLTPERATQNVIAPAAHGPGTDDAAQSVIAPAPRGPGTGDAAQSVVAPAPHGPGAGDAAGDGRRAIGADAARGERSTAATPSLRVILTAHCDVPSGGLLRRLARRGIGSGMLGGRLPGPFAWVVLGLLAVAACAGARLADVEGSALGAIQLVPTLVLLVALGLLLDAALARPVVGAGREPSSGDARVGESGAGGSGASGSGADLVSAADVVIAAARVFDATPPRRLAVEVVIAGAGEGQAVGFLAYLRRRRPDAERNVVIEVVDGSGTPAPTWWTSDAALLPLRYHPRLVALAAAAAHEEPQLNARGRRGRVIGAALRARQRRIPAIRLAAPDPTDALALTLALIELLDEDRG